jgi:hypothetical protein
MYPFLPKGTTPESTTGTTTGPTTGTTTGTTGRGRGNPLRALVTWTGARATRATWSPTR